MDGNGRLVKASAVSLATRSPGSRGVHSGSQLASSGKGERQALFTNSAWERNPAVHLLPTYQWSQAVTALGQT